VVAGVAPRGAPGWDAMPARNRRLFALARWCAPALRPVVRRIGGAIARDADGALERLFDRVAPVDAAALARGPARDALLASWAECLRQGPDGVWWDLVLEARAWGVPLAGVALPVLLWFGGADRTVPPAMGHHLARVLPQCEARHYPAEGHFTIVLNRRGEILDRLAAAVGARAGP
jgi:pimeloyl-ACP methyl ester carboxylesterase